MSQSILTYKPDWQKWYSNEWRTYYYETLRDVSDMYADGTIITFKQKTMNIPALITNTWIRTLYANELCAYEILPDGTETDETDEPIDYLHDNKIVIGDGINTPKYFDMTSIITSTLAYGSVFIDFWDGNVFTMVYNYKTLRDFTGGVVGYTYNQQANGKNIKVEHLKVGDGYVKKVNDVETETSKDDFWGFEVSNIFRLDNGCTLPMYGYALTQIESINDAFSEMNNDRVLSRKMVLVPRQLPDNQRAKLENNKTAVPIMDKNNRIFKVYDIKEGMNMTPLYVDGKYNPEPYEQDINMNLKLVGPLAGFGPKRFALDNSGALKTAEEVRADSYVDMVTERMLISEVIGSLVSNVVSRVYGRPIHVEVTGSKEELESVQDRDKRLLSEYMAGLISIKDYHKGRGWTVDDIDELDIIKNPPGLTPDKYLAEQQQDANT